jgi:hypothetical protein
MRTVGCLKSQLLLAKNMDSRPTCPIKFSKVISLNPKLVSFEDFLIQEDLEQLLHYHRSLVPEYIPSDGDPNKRKKDPRQMLLARYIHLKAYGREFIFDNWGIGNGIDTPILDILKRATLQFVHLGQQAFSDRYFQYRRKLDIGCFLTRYDLSDEEDRFLYLHNDDMDGKSRRVSCSLLLNDAKELVGGAFQLKNDSTDGTQLVEHKQAQNEALLYDNCGTKHGIAKMRGRREVLSLLGE